NPVNYCQYLVHSLKHVPSPTDKASWGGAPTKRISTRNSTSKASWGRLPTEKFSSKKGTSIVSCIMNCNDLTAINRQGIGIVSDFSFLIGE
ncbi:hypothetical protein HMPREF2538_00235, partial [Staphylococcus sp. HMSC063E12]|uniref:hypothetical protein n=1 Tax=Staphylococcus sp. HMSC063E12 TaxID=1715018 RepID=UPI000911476D